MKSTKKFLLAVCALAIAIVALLVVFFQFSPKAQAGSKAYTIEVIDDQGQTTSYEGRTDQEYLRGIMDELQAIGGFSYAGDESDYGIYIKTINDVTADYDTDGAYWSIMVNGEYGQYGADSQPVTDGDAFQFVYTKG